MRNIKELLQIVIDSLKDDDKPYFYNFGICGELDDLHDSNILGSDEYELLFVTIRKNKPSIIGGKFQHFTESKYWNGQDSAFWWPQMDRCPESRQIRVDFLNQLKDYV